MQLIATGKWSKAKKRWMMVVALKRPAGVPSLRSASSAKRPTRPPQS